MGKLHDLFAHIGTPAGPGLGFLGRATAAKPRPAALFVTIGTGDAAVASAMAQAGADGVIVTGWAPESDTAAIANALGRGQTIWGVELGMESAPTGLLKRAQAAGATFAVLRPQSAAGLLFEEAEKLDRMVVIEPPQNDVGLLLLRAQSLLPAQAALVDVRLSGRELGRLSIADFTRLGLLVQSLRFPALVTLAEAPEPSAVRVLVEAGARGLVLPGEHGAAPRLGEQLRALREELERTPIPDEERPGIVLGGMVATAIGTATPPEPPQREPERESGSERP